MDITKEIQLEMYRRMVRIREFELAAMDLFKRGKVKGAIHPYIGQEASGVGVCMALRKDDLIAGTHRSHGHNIAKGAEPKRMMAEVLGKVTGYCQGRGGSMHIAAFDTGSLGALAVVGAGIPLAVGAALAFSMRNEDRVAVPFTGEGGANSGNWHESLNMASIWNLPVVFVLENNHYGVSTNIHDVTKVKDLSVRASAYGIPGVRVDGFDVLAVYRAAREAVARARQGLGPTLLVTESYRFEGHYAGEPEVYRDKAEVERYRQRDPIPRFRYALIESGLATELIVANVEEELRQEMIEAVEFAQQSPEPDPDTAMEFIYA
ncbi:MAG TPA: thiamine pyrophosphate-dependent dehydrogenase E1 component subunit alpha [candidate division Zixibacteria bacterium]|nr:thiamine pyrophosphate-dependent dehydrogenase E1 component subunit alpha [candidate division Zixibacteria bacterium]